ncbi:hypothetical protein QZH56_36880 (plasmid) [Streptomyces olivoreticuli]|uniref:hypothetical protein n=1 Tax=Streptomyces olivoreticuli TaxID=68246 RepID=UPI002658C368|nr:hypothetical protein [Streptomyces olivoreticuli]WKK27829.1 hypothetical protein QZH56_36880 [Streptomyces olivoreticuli]
MAFGDITTTDLNGWQYRAIGVLNELVQAALKAERYPLNWTVMNNGALLGQVHLYDPKQTDVDRRAIFAEWCRVLEASEPRESKRFEGGIRLTATFARPTNRGDVKGSLALDIDLDDDQAEDGRG